MIYIYRFLGVVPVGYLLNRKTNRIEKVKK